MPAQSSFHLLLKRWAENSKWNGFADFLNSSFYYFHFSNNVFTDNQGWKNSTAAQSQQKNLNLSQERAQSVSSYLLSCGVSTNQIKGVQGMGESDPVASNDTAAGREQNRRVEVYMYASEQMIKDAQAASN